MLGSFFTDLLEKHLLLNVVYLVVQNKITILREAIFTACFLTDKNGT
jgi:hypothetical protein